jgi:hypothetical protein
MDAPENRRHLCHVISAGFAYERSSRLLLTGVTHVVVLGQMRYQNVNQIWKLIGDCAPENIQIDVEVGMHEPVSHTDNRIPWNVL